MKISQLVEQLEDSKQSNESELQELKATAIVNFSGRTEERKFLDEDDTESRALPLFIKVCEKYEDLIKEKEDKIKKLEDQLPQAPDHGGGSPHRSG